MFGHGSSIDDLREEAKAHPWEDTKEFLADTFAGSTLMPIIGNDPPAPIAGKPPFRAV